MKKILPVKDPIEIISYKPFDASRIAILLTQEKICHELYENFIHYRIEKVYFDGRIELDCHFNEEFSSIGIKKIPIDLLLNMNIKFVEFCKESIDKDFYLFIPIETSEVSNYNGFVEAKGPHHIFVYGYDDDTQTFECGEFFEFSKSGYSFESVSYRELENAFTELQRQTKPEFMNNEHLQWLKDIQLLHSFSEYNDKFSLKRVQVALKHYLDEKDCYGNKDYLKDVYYGYAIYDLLKEYLERVIDEGRKFFDVRTFYMIYLHFRYLRLQAEFINKNYVKDINGMDPFIDKFSELEKSSHMLMSLVLKYRITHKTEILERAIPKLIKLKEEDNIVLNKYIEYLNVF